jgi:sec-independent protein translocase protein TatB
VQQELHNDAVMQELRKTGQELKQQTDSIGQDVRGAVDTLPQPGEKEEPGNSAPPEGPGDASK